jgi:hypothetical protein
MTKAWINLLTPVGARLVINLDGYSEIGVRIEKQMQGKNVLLMKLKY